MRKNWRRVLAAIGVALMLIQVFSGPALAGESSLSASQTLAEPKISLEKAILIVKTNFEVPKEYTDFNSTYNTYDDRQVWSLHWNGPSGRPGEFAAEVSTVNGDILSINFWKNDEQSSNNELQPSITKLDAQKISDNLLANLLGERAKQLRLLPSDQMVVPINNLSPTIYSFQYQRLMNDIPFVSNGVNVQVSSYDGHITSYNLNWSEVEAPEVKGVINLAQAQQAFAISPYFKLEYWVPAPYKPLVARQKLEARLVYQLSGQSGGAIDAFTGEPLQLAQGDWLATDSTMNGGMGSAKGEKDGSVSNRTIALTPQEQQEVDCTAKLLKRDEAIAAVQRWIGVPDYLTLRSANLGTDWRSTETRIWNFNWNNTGSEKSEGKAQYLSASVSATTGELLGFNISFLQNGKTETKLDRTAAQKVAEEFLKKVQPDRFSQVSLVPDNLKDKTGQEPWNMQSFSYQRVANGVNFPNNGMTVNVDPVTGLLTSYELNWLELDLPSITGVLSKDMAVATFLKERPLTLVYVRIYSNGLPGSLRLVYLPVDQDRSMPISNTLDAKSGEMLDYQGQPLEKGPKPYYFTDLTEVSGARELAALGQAGLFGEYGNSFKPLEKMSISSLLRAMYLSRFGLEGNTGLSEDEIITKAKEKGWLKEDLQPGDLVNREVLAKVLLRYIQLNKMAELNGIYKVNFQDANQISPDALGYIALASSTGILKVEGQVLAPREALNRAEAAVALFKALSWRS